MASRVDVLIQSNAIAKADLQLLSNYVRRAQMTDSLVSNFDDAVESEWVIDRKIRDTQEIQLTSAIAQTLHHLVEASIASYIDPFYALQVRDKEPPQILHYGVGGHYIPHVDAETLYKDEGGLDLWEKTLDRDLSVVYFLNDDFEGGELVFPQLDLVIKPEAGTLVCFPSDHNFIHGVQPVSVGHRYTVVTWMRVAGMPTLEQINAATMDAYNRAWPRQLKQPSRIAKGSRTKNASR